MPKEIQVILLSLPFTTFFEDKNRLFVEKYKRIIADAFQTNAQLLTITKSLAKLINDEELIKLLEGAGPVLSKLCP